MISITTKYQASDYTVNLCSALGLTLEGFVDKVLFPNRVISALIVIGSNEFRTVKELDYSFSDAGKEEEIGLLLQGIIDRFKRNQFSNLFLIARVTIEANSELTFYRLDQKGDWFKSEY